MGGRRPPPRPGGPGALRRRPCRAGPRRGPLTARLKRWARAVRRDAHALWLAARDPRTPLAARLFALAVAAYALSPIDLIPDAIPLLGLLDEAILLPLAILALRRMIPPDLLAEHRAAAEAAMERPVSRAGAAVVAGLWLALAALFAWWALG